MAHYSKIFSKVPVQIQNRSGFDMSHENIYSATVGTLTPCLCEEILPGDKVSLGSIANVQLPPMATDFFGRVDARWEAFFVPARLCWAGWQKFVTQDERSSVDSAYPSSPANIAKPFTLPSFTISRTPSNDPIGVGSLADYLGFKVRNIQSGTSNYTVKNILPFIAYHRIWQDWYRDSNLQNPCFIEPNSINSGGTTPNPYLNRASCLPYSMGYVSNAGVVSVSNPELGDGVNLFSLRQRSYAKDYFTSATTNPQAGTGASFSFSIDSEAGTGSFTIAGLRAANSLQKWLERNNIAGTRYADQINAQFGVVPSDAVMDRPVYLGSATSNVYTKSVYQSSYGQNNSSSTAIQTQNPFKSQGAKYGSSQAVNDFSLVDGFEAKEHGYLMVLFSLVPHAYYSTGTRRYLNREKISDFAFPLLAGVGDQAIRVDELVDTPSSVTFGYTQRYAEYKYHDDEVHGLLRDGQSLGNFALKRGFQNATLGTSFLEIPKNALDEVAAVNGQISSFGCWVDQYFTLKMSRVLPAYSIPTLGDEKDTHTEIVDKGGKRL